MEMQAVCMDNGDMDKPSRWTIILTNGKNCESFEYSMGPAYRKLKNRMVLGFHPLPDGFRWGKKIPPIFRKTIYIANLLRYSEPLQPEMDNVLYCLLSDANCVRHGQSFEEFCQELGYNRDSISHKQIYDSLVINWRKLVKLGVNFEELEKKYENH